MHSHEHLWYLLAIGLFHSFCMPKCGFHCVALSLAWFPRGIARLFEGRALCVLSTYTDVDGTINVAGFLFLRICAITS